MKICSALFLLLTAIAATSQPASAAEQTNYRIVERIKVPDGGFDYATFDPAADRIYMPRGNFTTVIDPKANTASVFTNGESNHIALPVPGTNLLVLTQGAKSIIRILDRTNDQIIADLPSGGKNPNSAAYDPVTKQVLVLNKDSGNAVFVDPVAHKIVDTISISPNVLEFPVADGKGRIFDNIETTGQIAVIDARQHKVIGIYNMPGCENPSGLAYAPGSGVLISSCRNGMAKIVRASDGAVMSTVPIGRGPDAAIYDQKRKLAFIPGGGDGVLEVISLADPAHAVIVQHVPTQVGSRTGTLDPNTGRLYLMASQPDPSIPGGRGRLAGSWQVLVIAP
ncbi:MAG TPA: hypothetical protein VFW28_14290 [Micropepsaceae bacterium]|nr:hypothetical protein [Micropepsaceae bacterium]